MVPCQAGAKPLVLLHLLRAHDFPPAICFTNSVEASHRLARLLQLFGGANVSPPPPRAPPARRPRAARARPRGALSGLRAGGRVLVAAARDAARGAGGADGAARAGPRAGVAADRVRRARARDRPPCRRPRRQLRSPPARPRPRCRPCQALTDSAPRPADAPRHIKTYVHRAGRTARAGREGVCYTLLQPPEVKPFKALLRLADNGQGPHPRPPAPCPRPPAPAGRRAH